MSIEGIKKLEYRGYDSCGVAYSDGTGNIERVRSIDGIEHLRLQTIQESSPVAIAHSRWSTTGVPSVINAHPHVSRGVDGTNTRIAVVHNGIIENYQDLRAHLIGLGYHFESQTDTEVIGHLIDSNYNGNILKTVQLVVKLLTGSYAIAVMCQSEANKVVVAKYKSPLVIGIGDDEAHYVASDVTALPTNKVVYIDDGMTAEISTNGLFIYDAEDHLVDYEVEHVEIEVVDMATNKFEHYMMKEIHDQPGCILKSIENKTFDADMFGEGAQIIFDKIDRISIIACGTSHNAGLVGKTWLETIANIPTEVHIASEYVPTISHSNTLIVTISQSGETSDVLNALQRAKNAGMIYTLCICNSSKSALVRENILKYFTVCGSEISVASTKAFTSQLVALYILANVLAGTSDDIDLSELPQAIERSISFSADDMKDWSEKIHEAKSAIFLGKGTMGPVATEGALKLKEISYIHAEGLFAGELKHGTIALIDEFTPVIALVADGPNVHHMKTAIDEVLCRKAIVYAIVDQHVHMDPHERLHIVRVPYVNQYTSPIIQTIPLQMLSYFTAVRLGKNVDKPRNLSKSVTVS